MMTKLMQIWQIQSCTNSEDHVINNKPKFKYNYVRKHH